MSYSELYEDIYGSVEVDFKQIENLIVSSNVKKIIEIGSGSGRLLPLYEKHDLSVTLVDCSSEMNSIVVEKINKLKLQNYSVIKSYSFSLKEISDEMYDLVIFAFAGITEMSPLMFTLSEASRVLKEGGIIYFCAMNPNRAYTSALGLNRSILAKSKRSITAENFLIPTKGVNYFEVQVESRAVGSITKHIVEQVHPRYEDWLSSLSHCNLNIVDIYGDFVNSKFDVNNSPLIVITAKKNSLFNCITENSKIANIVYDNMADKYDDISSGDHYKVPSWFISKTSKYAGYHPIVLDLGCATGTVGRMLDQTGVDSSFLFGIDISNKMVDLCRKSKRYDAVAQVDMATGLIEYKYFLYDIVCCLGVLEFIDEPLRIFKKVFNLLKIGGDFFFTLEYSSDSDNVELFKLPYGEFRKYSYTKESATKFLEEAGFLIADIKIDDAYVSPSTGKTIYYLFCHAIRK